ncbi:arsenate reductase (glutaredoxin) [Noviherbaspirillum sp. CPCC 100848]|uniref:Arsenate reductase n=1 Tax=Noviherbaspirillum album TaxID=3080276 RepID=A0ABU6JHT5_9BURK|nr:arsenate reductase (glutaredoxin) [Noviherbaspirillum sp. CPCC 100848]MEC4723233.1 arsenate reductase (glutaredoxin) [Noviherbaspirillum sp. CPCC 100848]
MIKIFHNPQCSKSREALTLVENFCRQHDMPLEIVKYLEAPLTRSQLAALREQLGIPAETMMRQNEDEYASMELAQADDDALLHALAGCPKLLQRPIVAYRDKAIIARPPHLLNDFLR